MCFAPQRALTALQTARSQLACATYNGLPGGLATLVHTEIQKGREALRGALGDGAAAGVQRTALHGNALPHMLKHVTVATVSTHIRHNQRACLKVPLNRTHKTLYVSFAEYNLFNRALLQKKPIISVAHYSTCL